MSVSVSSSTAAPFDLKSFEDRLIRISVADSLHANPSSIVLSTSGGSLLWDKINVRRNMAVEKNFLIEAGITRSLWLDFFELN